MQGSRTERRLVSREEERGQRIAQLREERLWTRERLAKEAAVSTTTVTQAEQGLTHIRLATIGKLAKALGVDPQELLHPKALAPPSSPLPPEEIQEERRILFGLCAAVLDEINGGFGPYLVQLSDDPTPDEWQSESAVIKKLLSGIEVVVNRMSRDGIMRKLEPYIDAIAAGAPISAPLEEEVRRLRYSYAVLFARTIPLAIDKWRTRLGGADLEQLDTLEALVSQWRSSTPAEAEIQR
jgi:transcriptional regulator with XRE-family HTH domain